MRVAMGGGGGAAHMGIGGNDGNANWLENNLDALIAAAAQENAADKKKKKTRIWEKADREVPISEHEELRRDTLVTLQTHISDIHPRRCIYAAETRAEMFGALWF